MTIDAAARARSFDAWAGEYDRYRPGYPSALFELIAERVRLPASPRVADLGAGTGKASIAMARCGWRVTAVEPGPAMLEVLHARAADEGVTVTAVASRAEETGLRDASVDLATAAQAFHFFDTLRALGEMVRIVRSGGGVALFWNVRDDVRSPFLRDYTALLQRFVGVGHLERRLAEREVDTRAEMEAIGAFADIERFEVAHEMASDPDHFIGMAFTSSYVRAGLDAERQKRFRADLTQLIARHHGRDAFTIPYQVECWTARRAAA
jgi:ubiquinone/menaquinone biosynthesis C-methylase UbiE